MRLPSRRIFDGLTRGQRHKRKLADWVVCPSCDRRWQRTNQQRQDGTVCCSQRCAAHRGNLGRSLRASRDAVLRYQQMIRDRVGIVGDQVRDVEVADIVRLMLEARRDGIGLGIQRGLTRATRIKAA